METHPFFPSEEGNRRYTGDGPRLASAATDRQPRSAPAATTGSTVVDRRYHVKRGKQGENGGKRLRQQRSLLSYKALRPEKKSFQTFQTFQSTLTGLEALRQN